MTAPKIKNQCDIEWTMRYIFKDFAMMVCTTTANVRGVPFRYTRGNTQKRMIKGVLRKGVESIKDPRPLKNYVLKVPLEDLKLYKYITSDNAILFKVLDRLGLKLNLTKEFKKRVFRWKAGHKIPCAESMELIISYAIKYLNEEEDDLCEQDIYALRNLVSRKPKDPKPSI